MSTALKLSLGWSSLGFGPLILYLAGADQNVIGYTTVGIFAGLFCFSISTIFNTLRKLDESN